jgi:hypothetical protein
MHVYLSPEHAGKSTATLAGWGVDDVDRVVEELASKGVAFERYDEGPIVTDEKGSAKFVTLRPEDDPERRPNEW